jgi:ABC-type transport system involved in multi-copper enzyme maturation permease subunit
MTKESASLQRGLTATWVLFWHHVRGLALARRNYFLLLLLMIPLMPVVVMRIIVHFGHGPELWEDQAFNFYNVLKSAGYLNFLVVLTGLFWATPLYVEELKSGAARFLFLAPAQRFTLPISKYLAFVAVSSLQLGLSLATAFILLGLGGTLSEWSLGSVFAVSEWSENWTMLLKDWSVLTLALASYGALFALLGLIAKRPLLWGLLFIFIWDKAASVLPGSANMITIRHYLRTLLPHYQGAENMLPLLTMERPISSVSTSLTVLLVFCACTLLIASYKITHGDLVMPDTVD